MAIHELTLIAERGQSPAERAQRLMEEARAAASEQVSLLEHALMVVAKLSAQIAVGGDVYPVGIRDLSRKMADDALWCSQTCASIQKNTGVFTPTPDVTPRDETLDEEPFDLQQAS